MAAAMSPAAAAATDAALLQQGNPHLTAHDANVLATYASALEK